MKLSEALEYIAEGEKPFAIVLHDTGEVLMHGYMTTEALLLFKPLLMDKTIHSIHDIRIGPTIHTAIEIVPY